ncbi:Bug family tripartite tricarboxylate transporter substrate binding protein [Reyranella sp.]|uniref:Bug family tripartite tricarboxylate transporter substrate binding protein n=1 Tax=Reyranella sp. TaxID=1929291 RepID=UPI003BAAFF3E
MSIKRRIALAAIAVCLSVPAFGQAYPAKPITMIVPFAAGGPTDALARILGERMAKELGQQIIIENVTGAAGTIAMAKLARAAPDGYTIGIGHLGTNVANAVIYTKLGFDLLGDLEPITRLPANPMLVVSSTAVPAKTLKELVDYLKANPDKVSGGTAGMGSGSHLGALEFNKATAAKYQLVPYRGTGPAMQDLIANQIQVMVDQSSNALPQAQAGKIRAYAVTSARRSPAMPDIPTAAEAGFPMEIAIWNGLWAPKGTPAAIVDKLAAAATAALAEPAVRKRMQELGMDLPTANEMKPAAFAAFQKAEFAKWKPILEAAGVKVE